MNKGLLYSLMVLLFSAWAFQLQAQMTFKARLSGRHEAPAVLSRGSGELTAVLTDSTLVLTGSFKNLLAPVDTNVAGGSHIHRGYAGQTGPVMFGLMPVFNADMTGGTYEAGSNTFTLSSAQVQALMDRRFYINIHTTAFAGGEIRGQLLPEAESYFSTNLFGSNEVPPVVSGGAGALVLELDGNNLVVTGSFSDLDGDFASNIAGGSHLHAALAGSNSGISVTLNATVDANLKGGIYEASNNTFTLDSAQVAALKNRQMYANIHSTLYPAGELRGQLVAAEAIAVFRAHLTGSSEVPVVTSRADGVVLLEVLKDSLIEASGSFRNLSAPLATSIGGGAHIHTGMAGRNGPVAYPLTSMTDAALQNGTFGLADNTFSFTASEADQLFSRGLYVNIHSENHLGGEIRGQLLPEGQTFFNTWMSSAYSVPEVYSGARGDIKAELNGGQLVVSGSFNNLGAPLATNISGGVHIHVGLAGETGGIVFPLTATADPDNLGGVFHSADNSFVLDSAQTADLKARRFYVNVHSAAHPSGEIRGQILPQATAYFAAPLSGASEVDAVKTGGAGMLVAEVNGANAYVSGSFSGLSSPVNVAIAGGAHIHEGMAGQNAGIDFPLGLTLAADSLSGKIELADNVFNFTPGNIDTMFMRMNYANIHTLANAGGEIRGQFLPLATHYYTTTLRGLNEVDINGSAAKGDMKFEIVGNVLTVHGSFNSLESEFNVNVSGGSHLHIAMPGENGGVAFPLVPTLGAGNLSGVYAAADNVFALDSAQTEALAEGNFYVNIHTVDIPSGEIRGQVLKETNAYPAPETNITAPPAGATVTIEGDPTTPFSAEWLPGFEPDGNKQVYIWQLAADSNFTTLVFQTYTASNSFTTDFGTVDALLAAAGLAVGDTIPLYHRALGTDGSLADGGTWADVRLIRGVVTTSSQGVDLELGITANVTSYTQYVDVTYTVTITNNGTETATGVTVAAGLPTGMVHTFNSTTKGTYSLYFETWKVGTLEPGETGTLTLVLFPLINDADITNFVQVMTQDQADADSTPGNDTDQTPNEDDEAAVTVLSPPQPPMGGVTADLELFATADSDQYDIYEHVAYKLTLVNNGPDDAAGINVLAGLPQGMVHSSNFATHGQYNLFYERWETGFIAAGDTAYLDLVLFPLVDNVDLTNFFEVLTCDQDDPDSTPGNGACCTAQEDDEAVVMVMPMPFISDPPQNFAAAKSVKGQVTLYPNPASVAVKIQLQSTEEQAGAHLAVFDQTGRLVLLHKTDVLEGANEWTVDVSTLTAGVYFVKLPGAETLRFVKV